MGTPIQAAAELGHSIWYDNLQRSMLTSGDLAAMISDGLRGLTSNPSIFEKAMGHSADYDAQLSKIAPQLDDVAAFEALAIQDIQGACDAFLGLYHETKGDDGFVSLEVSPRHAHDTQGTIDEAKRLHKAVGRPNVMIKIPGTKEGVPAIQAGIAAGININTTLLFSVDAYLAAANAYISGLEIFESKGGDVSKVAGVASFFLSRIDTAVDNQLGKDHKELHGKAAIANAKLAYSHYHELVAHSRWQALAKLGAKPQRLLWASTSTKNPAYDKLMYALALIGADTVDTVPHETYEALLGHKAKLHATLGDDLDGAKRTLAALGGAGVSLQHVTDKLLADGVTAFAKSFDTLLAAVADKRKKLAAH
jgi:transaldolase